MARPIKTGLDYFSFDVDFYDNLKVRKVMRACGPSAGSVLSCLLCNIYRWKGYYIVWDQDLPFDIADKVGVSEGAVTEVITKALQVDFFNNEMYDKHGILTSHEVQARYKSGTLKRSDVKIEPEFVVNEPDNKVNGGKNPVSSARSTQSKVKDSKVKETKVKHSLVAVTGNPHESKALKNEYQSLVNSLEGKPQLDVWNSLRDFIRDKKPVFIEPYFDAWNIFAISVKLIKQPQTITEKRRKKFSTRINEPGFDFLKILEKIKTSSFLKGDNNQNWKVSIEFILESEENYTKILEDKYQ